MSDASPTAVAASALPPPSLRVARFEDFDAIQTLERSVPFQIQPFDDWRRIWLDNPLWPRLSKHWPIGWVLEDASGKLVGSVVNVPSLYHFDGRELISAIGRAWVVLPEYRGFSLWIMDEYFNQEGADVFVNTTVGPMAMEANDSLSTRVPLGDWQTLAYRVTGYSGFARRALQRLRVPGASILSHPAGAALRVKDALVGKRLTPPALSAPVTIELTTTFDGRFDAFWQERVRQNPRMLLAARDSAVLAWHFAVPLRRNRVWVFTATRNGLLRAYCILKRQDQSSFVRRMRIVDFQSIDAEIDLLPHLLQAAEQQCAAKDIHTLEHRGVGLPKMKAFDEVARYRTRLDSWPFYYRANDPSLHAALGDPAVWDPSEYDGDASFE